MIIAVSGWRNNKHNPGFLHRACIEQGIELHRITWRVGDCPTGTDLAVREALNDSSIMFEVYRADWEQFGKFAGPNRNNNMLLGMPDGKFPVGAKADQLWAWPQPHEGYHRSGTWGCVSTAFTIGVKVVLFPPPAPKGRPERFPL